MQFSCHLHSLLLCSDGNKSLTWDKAASAWQTLGTDPSLQLPPWKSTAKHFQMENSTFSLAKMWKWELVHASDTEGFCRDTDHICARAAKPVRSHKSRARSGACTAMWVQHSQQGQQHGSTTRLQMGTCVRQLTVLRAPAQARASEDGFGLKQQVNYWLLFVSPKITVNGLFTELSYSHVKVNWGNCSIYFGSKSCPLEGVSWSGIDFLMGVQKMLMSNTKLHNQIEIWSSVLFLGTLFSR